MFLCCKILKLISLAYAAVSYLCSSMYSSPPCPLFPLPTIYGHVSTSRAQLIVLHSGLACSAHVATWPGFSTIVGTTKGRINVYKLYLPARQKRQIKNLHQVECTVRYVSSVLRGLGKCIMQERKKKMQLQANVFGKLP